MVLWWCCGGGDDVVLFLFGGGGGGDSEIFVVEIVFLVVAVVVVVVMCYGVAVVMVLVFSCWWWWWRCCDDNFVVEVVVVLFFVVVAGGGDSDSVVNIGVHENAMEEVFGSHKKFHKAIGFMLAILIPSVGFKYQGSLTNVIKEHSVAFNLFLGDAFVYAIAILMVAMNPNSQFTTSLKYIFLVLGITECLLVLFIAVTSLWWFLGINAFGFMCCLIFQSRWHNIIFQTGGTLLVQVGDKVRHFFHSLCQQIFPRFSTAADGASGEARHDTGSS
ncbi:hypothetical protein TIFTF001_038539, partial [Ficus carica]